MRLIDADVLKQHIDKLPALPDGNFAGNHSALKALINMQPTIQPVATDTNVGDKISKFIDGLEEIFADLREKHVDDSVCGLCEYDGAYIGQSGDWCNECPGFEKDDCFKLSDKTRKEWTEEIINALPTIQPEKAQLSREGTTSDLISRMETVEHLRRVLDATVPITDYDEGYVDGVEFGISTVSIMPTIQPERKNGEWIDYTKDGYVECPFCHSATNCDGNKDELHFCFSCGADMRGGLDERG